MSTPATPLNASPASAPPAEPLDHLVPLRERVQNAQRPPPRERRKPLAAEAAALPGTQPVLPMTAQLRLALASAGVHARASGAAAVATGQPHTAQRSAHARDGRMPATAGAGPAAATQAPLPILLQGGAVRLSGDVVPAPGSTSTSLPMEYTASSVASALSGLRLSERPATPPAAQTLPGLSQDGLTMTNMPVPAADHSPAVPADLASRAGQAQAQTVLGEHTEDAPRTSVPVQTSSPMVEQVAVPATAGVTAAEESQTEAFEPKGVPMGAGSQSTPAPTQAKAQPQPPTTQAHASGEPAAVPQDTSTRVTVPFASYGPGHQVTAIWGAAGMAGIQVRSSSERGHQAVVSALEAGMFPGDGRGQVQASRDAGEEGQPRQRPRHEPQEEDV